MLMSVNLSLLQLPHPNTNLTVVAPLGQFNTVTKKNGFNSGFMPFDPTSKQVGVFSLEVVDPNTPIWFFCGRPPHCKMG